MIVQSAGNQVHPQNFVTSKLVCLITAIQRRKVAVGDIAGAFLQSDYQSDREDYLWLEGLMVDILIQIVPEYTDYVSSTKKGTKI